MNHIRRDGGGRLVVGDRFKRFGCWVCNERRCRAQGTKETYHPLQEDISLSCEPNDSYKPRTLHRTRREVWEAKQPGRYPREMRTDATQREEDREGRHRQGEPKSTKGNAQETKYLPGPPAKAKETSGTTTHPHQPTKRPWYRPQGS